MALYSRKEFIELCGLDWNDSSRAKISMWIKRQNIVEADGKIDDAHPKNRDWVLKQRDAAQAKPVMTVSAGEPRQNPQPKPQKDLNYESVDRRLKAQQLAKLTVETRLAELKEEKIRAEVVPVDLIKSLFQTHTQSIITSQKEAIEDLLINLSVEARLTGDQLAKLRSKAVTILNNSVDKAIRITEGNMKALVDEFSIKKEVGEHE